MAPCALLVEPWPLFSEPWVMVLRWLKITRNHVYTKPCAIKEPFKNLEQCWWNHEYHKNYLWTKNHLGINAYVVTRWWNNEKWKWNLQPVNVHGIRKCGGICKLAWLHHLATITHGSTIDSHGSINRAHGSINNVHGSRFHQNSPWIHLHSSWFHLKRYHLPWILFKFPSMVPLYCDHYLWFHQ